jgi:hypothetical protein
MTKEKLLPLLFNVPFVRKIFIFLAFTLALTFDLHRWASVYWHVKIVLWAVEEEGD